MTIQFRIINNEKHYYGVVNGLCLPLTSKEIERLKGGM